MTTDRLDVLQTDLQQIWLDDRDALTFDRQPVHVFALQSDADDAAAAVILTTQTEPGNPEQHLANPPLHYLHQSTGTSILAFVPRDMAEDVRLNISDYEDVIYSTLFEVDHGIDAETGIFCICRFNPWMCSGYEDPIPVYRVPGGYILQFNPEYSFAPDEMAVE